jgi:septal ring factor EnvC (AmiA/AmiB activator)
MPRSFPPVSLILPALLLAGAGCATNLDMTSSKDRMDALSGRIDIVEKAVARSAGQTAAQSLAGTDRVDALEKETADLRKSYADQQMTVSELSGKLEAILARLTEVENAVAAQQRKGLAIDKSIETLTVKLEAQVRDLGEQIRKLAAPPAP